MKHQKAFTLIELLVVISIIGIMTAVLLMMLANDRDRRSVRAEAEKFVAVMREVQNKALTGSKIGTLRSCEFTMNSSTDGYETTAKVYDPSIADNGCGAGKINSDEELSSLIFFEDDVKKIVGPTDVRFGVPFAEISGNAFPVGVSDSSVEFLFEKGDFEYKVCLYRSGRIESVGFSGADCE